MPSAFLKRADRGIDEAAQHVPAVFLSEERYAQHMRIAERDWSCSSPGGCAQANSAGHGLRASVEPSPEPAESDRG